MDIDNIPICMIILDLDKKISKLNNCFKKEMESLKINTDVLTGKEIKQLIPEYDINLYKERLFMYFNGKTLKCIVSTNSSDTVYIEILPCSKRFMDFLGYEFKTPISASVELISLLNLSKIPKDQQKYILAIKKNNSQLTRVLIDTIDYLKLISLELQFIKEDFNLELCFDLIKNYILNDKDIIITYDIVHDIRIFLDKKKFIEMNIHIITYAIKSMNSGVISIKTKVKNNVLNIYYTDNSKKINQSEKDLFKGFIHKNYKSSHFGLNLPIAKGLAEGNGGSLVLEKTGDYGNTFKFSVDIYKEDSD